MYNVKGMAMVDFDSDVRNCSPPAVGMVLNERNSWYKEGLVCYPGLFNRKVGNNNVLNEQNNRRDFDIAEFVVKLVMADGV